MASKSTRARKRRKAGSDRPPKPYKDFPLGPHASGSWCKRIRGTLRYFGKWGRVVNGKLERIEGDGWQAALDEYERQKEALYSGRTPRAKTSTLTVADLCNRFRTAKLRSRESGEITGRTYDEYTTTCDLLVAAFGKDRLVDDLAADDFEALRVDMAKRWGPVRLGNEVGKVRTVFKYGYEAGVIDKPVRFGPQFKKPSASVLRRHKAANGERMIEADELRRLIDAAPVPLKAMILLGVNCGLGNHDCALLPLKALDLKGGWLRFPRPKTGIERRCPLWPETVTALKDALAERPTPKSDSAADKVFLTVRGRPWLSRDIANPVSVAARRLMKTVGIDGPGLGFYTLRHVFRTVADGTRDQVAVNHIMGHVDASMGANYRERIEDVRLMAVVDYVHAWLWPKAPEKTTKSAAKPKRQQKPRAVKSKTPNDQPRLRLFIA